jgi:hypothetical protein
VGFFHSLGVYFGVSEETDEDRRARERGESRFRAFSLPRIVLNAALTVALGTLIVGLLDRLLVDSRPVTVANVIDEGLPLALFFTAVGLFRDFYVRRQVGKSSRESDLRQA